MWRQSWLVGPGAAQKSIRHPQSLQLSFARHSEQEERNVVSVRAAVFDCAIREQHDEVAAVLSRSAGVPWMFLERSFDDTPLHLSFGALTEELRPVARYVVPRGQRRLVGGRALASYDVFFEI